MALFKGRAGRDDTFTGGTKADRFEFNPLDLTGGDTIAGGDGRAVDTLRFTAPGAIGASALAHVSGIERIELAEGGANSLVVTDAFVSTATGATLQVIGSSGDELVYAERLTGVNVIDYTAGAGADLVIGGAGGDTFRFDVAELDSFDTVTGGLGGAVGSDVLRLTGFGAIGPDQMAGVSGIEAFVFGDDAIALTLTNELTSSAENGFVSVTGGAGNDTITATGVATSLSLRGGAGDDTILSGFGYTFADGGTGADTIRLGQGAVVYDAHDVSEQTSYGVLYVSTGVTIDLTQTSDQSIGDTVLVQGFTAVDASQAKSAVTLTGTDYGSLTGGAGNDTISGCYYLTGGAGADTLTSSAATGSNFILAQGDFERGEIIRGTDGVYDTVSVTGSVDFRTGTMTGIDSLRISAGLGKRTDVTLSSAQFAQLDSIGGNDAAAITVHVQLARDDLPKTYFSSFGATVDLQLTDKADVLSGLQGSVVVHGGGGNDTLSTNGAIYGDAGDDRITAGAGSSVHDGGTGNDTLVLTGYVSQAIAIALSARNQSVSGIGPLAGFENVDGRGLQNTGLTVTGSSVANVLYGTYNADVLSGGGGDDILSGAGGSGRDTLDGGTGNDLLFGSTGYVPVTMTGGAGADVFRWIAHPTEYFYFDVVGDTVTDFRPGQDVLQFATTGSGAFGIGAFDTRVVASGPRTDITGAGLVILRGGPIDDRSEIADYINSATGGSNTGVFVAAENSAGHTVLYFSPSGIYADDYYNGVTVVADLGTIRPTELQLSDFSFI